MVSVPAFCILFTLNIKVKWKPMCAKIAQLPADK